MEVDLFILLVCDVIFFCLLYYVKCILEDVRASLLYKLNLFTDVKDFILVGRILTLGDATNM